MKKLLIILCALFSFSAFASKPIGTLGAVDSVQIGGRIFTNLSSGLGGLIQLHGHVTNGTNTNTSFRKGAGVAGYAPSGVAFRVIAIVMTNFATVTAISSSYFYSSNDLGISSTTAITGQTYFGGNVLTSEIQPASTVAGAVAVLNTDFVVPSGQYLGATNQGQANEFDFQAYGFEQ